MEEIKKELNEGLQILEVSKVVKYEKLQKNNDVTLIGESEGNHFDIEVYWNKSTFEVAVVQNIFDVGDGRQYNVKKVGCFKNPKVKCYNGLETEIVEVAEYDLV